MTAYRFSTLDGQRDRRDAEVRIENAPVLRLSYGDVAELYRINLGWAQQKGDQPPGFRLDLEKGYWSRNQADNQDGRMPRGRAHGSGGPVCERHPECAGDAVRTRPIRRSWLACKGRLPPRSSNTFNWIRVNWPAKPCPRPRSAGNCCFTKQRKAGRGCCGNWWKTPGDSGAGPAGAGDLPFRPGHPG